MASSTCNMNALATSTVPMSAVPRQGAAMAPSARSTSQRNTSAKIGSSRKVSPHSRSAAKAFAGAVDFVVGEHAGTAFRDELQATAKKIASPGRGILAMDESNPTAGKRLADIGVENSEANRQKYRTILCTAPNLGEYISGAILFEETLYQNTSEGPSVVDTLNKQGIIPGIKVDKGLVPLVGAVDGELWAQGLDGLAARCADYYAQGARFAKWRSVVNISCGPSDLAMDETAWGLARYAAICQANGLVPIVEPEVMLDGDHNIETTYEVARLVWSKTFKALQDCNVMLEGILLKPSMVTPGASCSEKKDAKTVAEYTLRMLNERVPPAVPGITFLSGGQSEVSATEHLNEMNQTPNPWNVSFSYARALQNSVLKTWMGKDENIDAAKAALVTRARLNSMAQLGKYSAKEESDASEAAKEGMFVKGYQY